MKEIKLFVNASKTYISIETNLKLAEKYFKKFIELCEIDPVYNYYYLKYCKKYNNKFNEFNSELEYLAVYYPMIIFMN